ncbi:MAG: hypothetical protein MJ185_06200 [Treponema sp.]|nr:hypothetical protein [Treponema sp.]
MKNKLKKIVTAVLLCSAVFFSACKNNLTPLDREVKNEGTSETAKIVINADPAASERTALPVYKEYNTNDLQDIVLKWKNAASAEDSVKFRNAGEMSGWEKEFSLGNWTFTMEAKIGSVQFLGTSEVSLKRSDMGSTVPVNIILSPVETESKAEVKIRVKFPKDMNVSFVSGRCSRNNSFSSNYDIYNIPGSLPTEDDETDSSLAYVEFSDEFSTKDNNDLYIELTFKAEDGTENGKLFKFRTKAILEEGKTSYEEFTAKSEDFMTCYKINYYIGKRLEPVYVDYYTTEYGYTLYGPSSYEWYTDSSYITKASSKGPGASKGDLDFYLEAAYKITIKDCSGNLVGELLVKDGSRYYLGDKYIYLYDNSSVRVNFDRSGYYVRGRYQDIDKKNQKSYYSYYTPTSDETIYIDYGYSANVSFVSLNSGKEIYSFTANEYFYLYENSYTSHSSGDYIDFKVKAFYKDASKTQEYSKGTKYELENSETITIYVDEVMNRVNTLYLVDEYGNEIESVPFVNRYELYRRYYWSDKINSSEYYPNSYSAIYYKDAGFTERLSYNDYSLEEDGDVTVYVKLVQAKYISKTLEYNKAYKFPAEIGNSRLFYASSGRLDVNCDNMWCFSTTYGGGTYDVDLYYYAIDETKDCSYDVDPTDYVLAPENAVPVTPDVQSAGNDVSKYIVEDTTAIIKAYQYNLVKDDKVGIDIKDRLSSDTYIYVVNEDGTKYWGGRASSTSDWFTVPSSGVYTVYVRNSSEGIKTQISHHFYAYGMGSASGSVTLQTGDIEISVSDNSSEITLTASEGFQSYEWNLAGNLVGTERILTLDKTALNAGQSYAVVLTAVTGRNAVYKTTLVIDVE